MHPRTAPVSHDLLVHYPRSSLGTPDPPRATTHRVCVCSTGTGIHLQRSWRWLNCVHKYGGHRYAAIHAGSRKVEVAAALPPLDSPVLYMYYACRTLMFAASFWIHAAVGLLPNSGGRTGQNLHHLSTLKVKSFSEK